MRVMTEIWSEVSKRKRAFNNCDLLVSQVERLVGGHDEDCGIKSNARGDGVES